MKRRLVPIVMALAFAGVLVSFVVYTGRLADALRRDAEAFGRIYFRIVQATASEEGLTPADEFALLEELYALEVPVVITDLAGNPSTARNLPFEADPADAEDTRRIRSFVERLDARNEPLVDDARNFQIHYGEPLYLRQLKWIPWLQTAVLLGVVAIGVWMIRISFRSERERIWSAMARESAHQMGTPLSSLVGWLEHLQARRGAEADLLPEMRADVERLQKVSRRFELIGRPPPLAPVDVGDVASRLARYFAVRLPLLGSPVRLEMRIPEDAPPVRGNETLLEWALENLIKNAIDALAGREGEIGVEFMGTEGDRALFSVYDTGPGVPPSIRARLFDIGVTTKERGWGVGLSLTRRIIHDMHGGGIELENGEGGARFRIELPLAAHEDSDGRDGREEDREERVETARRA